MPPKENVPKMQNNTKPPMNPQKPQNNPKPPMNPQKQNQDKPNPNNVPKQMTNNPNKMGPKPPMNNEPKKTNNPIKEKPENPKPQNPNLKPPHTANAGPHHPNMKPPQTNPIKNDNQHENKKIGGPTKNQKVESPKKAPPKPGVGPKHEQPKKVENEEFSRSDGFAINRNRFGTITGTKNPNKFNLQAPLSTIPEKPNMNPGKNDNKNTKTNEEEKKPNKPEPKAVAPKKPGGIGGFANQLNELFKNPGRRRGMSVARPTVGGGLEPLGGKDLGIIREEGDVMRPGYDPSDNLEKNLDEIVVTRKRKRTITAFKG